jgi:hypothetical protein
MFVSDFAHFAKKYFSNPQYLSIDGRPVIYIWATWNFKGDYAATVEKAREVAAARGYDVFIVGDEVRADTFDERHASVFDANTAFTFLIPGTSQPWPWANVGEAATAVDQVYQQWRESIQGLKVAGRDDFVSFQPGWAPQFDNRLADLYNNHGQNPIYVPAENKEQVTAMAEVARKYAEPVGSQGWKLVWENTWNCWQETTTIEPTANSGPKYPAGNYQFDMLEVVREVFGPETFNPYAAKITAITLIPDPLNIGQGSKTIYTTNVQNTGSKAMSSAKVQVKIYKPGHVLASSPSTTIAGFAPSSIRTVQVTYTLPSTAQLGGWTYDVAVYYGATLLDSSTGGTFTVETPLVTADIAGAGVSPDPAGQGSKLTFIVAAHNTGNMILGSVPVRLKVYRPDGVLASSPSGSITNFVGGTERTLQVTYILPVTAMKGVWTYNVAVYYGATLLDSETGRTFTVESPVIAGQIVWVADTPDPVSHGGTATFTVTFRNTGNIVWSSARITVKVYKPGGTVLATQRILTVMNVAPGVDYTRNLTWLVPSTSPTGEYTYTVTLTYLTTTVATSTGHTINVN